MQKVIALLASACVALAVAGSATAAGGATSPQPQISTLKRQVAALQGQVSSLPLYKNCTAVNKKYPHGIGRVGARDRTSGKPVTNFKRSNKLYRTAMSYNKGLDRDKDGVACEKK